MSIEEEPYPVENGELWEEGSPQWLARYEYISERSERYLDSYRDSIDYDFTRTFGIKYQKQAVDSAYERYAAGTLAILGVKNCVANLRDGYKRKEVTPVSPEEKAQAAAKPEYVPKWKKDWDAKKDEERGIRYREMLLAQPSPDRTAFLTGRGYRDAAETSPMPGLNCYCVSADEGYLADGTKVDKGQAYLAVLWDCQDFYYPAKADLRPANLTGKPEPETPEEPQAGGFTLEDLRREMSEQAQEASLDRARSRGKRAGAGVKG